jgi:hypothetical protein
VFQRASKNALGWNQPITAAGTRRRCERTLTVLCLRQPMDRSRPRADPDTKTGRRGSVRYRLSPRARPPLASSPASLRRASVYRPPPPVGTALCRGQRRLVQATPNPMTPGTFSTFTNREPRCRLCGVSAQRLSDPSCPRLRVEDHGKGRDSLCFRCWSLGAGCSS